MPAIRLCASRLPRAGQAAPLESAISARMTAANANRTDRKVNGSASTIAYFATMKPLDHSSAKVSGVARTKPVLSGMDGMGGLCRHHVEIVQSAPEQPRQTSAPNLAGFGALP